MQRAALAVQERTGALFVVVTDDRGVRLAHPDRAELGRMVSTSPADVLAGRETVSWATGTLGESARAKVPVYATATDATDGHRASRPDRRVVGEASVGFARDRVENTLVEDSVPVVGAALAALALAAVASVLIHRRLVRLTPGGPAAPP